jgi:hypothetical protein
MSKTAGTGSQAVQVMSRNFSSSFTLPSKSLYPFPFSTACPRNVSAASQHSGFASSYTPPSPLPGEPRDILSTSTDLLLLTAHDIFQNATIDALHCPAWHSSPLARDYDSSTFGVARGRLPACVRVCLSGRGECGIRQGMTGRPTAA